MKNILLLLLVSSGLLLTSCYKEPENGTAKIIVIHNGYRKPSADIQLTGPAGSYINVSAISDQNGEFIYTHDPALEVILDVDASFTDGSGLHQGQGIIRIVPDETNEVTITLYP